MPGAQRATAEFEHCIELYIISMTLNKLGFRWIDSEIYGKVARGAFLCSHELVVTANL